MGIAIYRGNYKDVIDVVINVSLWLPYVDTTIFIRNDYFGIFF